MNPASTSAKDHWEKVYKEKDPTTGVSWYQAHPATSLKLIQACGPHHEQPLIDVGGGASTLVDCLLNLGFRDLSVIDISAAALEHSRARLRSRAGAVAWLEADVTTFEPSRPFRLWHDRAVFHFLTEPGARLNYIARLKRALVPEGWFILATFAKDGPSRCSGLLVERYDAASIQAELGSEFELVEQLRETHTTPWNAEQHFAWFRFQHRPSPPMKSNSA